MRTITNMIMVAFLVFTAGDICHAQGQKLTSVNVEIVNLDIETFVDVTCDAFDNTFKDEKNAKIFNTEQDLSKFQLLVKNLKSVAIESPDVRGSITYNYGKTRKHYCFDKFGYFYKDGKRYFCKNLLIYILDEMYTYPHPKYLDTLKQQ